MIQYTAHGHQFQQGNITSLWYFLHQVPDFRDKRGFKHPLPIILTLAVLALCCGRKSYEDIAAWGRDYQEAIVREIPFLAGHFPDPATFYRIFSSLDTVAFEAVFSSWVAVYAPSAPGDAIAIDGKTTAGDTLHTVAAFIHRAKSVLFQEATDTKGKELVVGSHVLAHIPLIDRIITADALHAQKKICETITTRRGGYVITVKDNQQTLKKDIETFFMTPPFGAVIASEVTTEKSRGRLEERRIETSSDLTAYLSWPGLTHVWQITRTITRNGKTTVEIAVGIARLLPKRDSPTHLAGYIRGHWGIENRLHRQRDVVFGEDASTIRKKRAPHTMTILRNIVTTFLHQWATRSFPATMKTFAARPNELFSVLRLSDCAPLYRYR